MTEEELEVVKRAAGAEEALGEDVAEVLQAEVGEPDLLCRPLEVSPNDALLEAMLWTFLLWLRMGSAFWTAFGALGIHLGSPAAMFTECAPSLFEAIPAGPGFLGTMQAGVPAGVHGIFGIETNAALSMEGAAPGDGSEPR